MNRPSLLSLRDRIRKRNGRRLQCERLEDRLAAGDVLEFFGGPLLAVGLFDRELDRVTAEPIGILADGQQVQSGDAFAEDGRVASLLSSSVPLYPSVQALIGPSSTGKDRANSEIAPSFGSWDMGWAWDVGARAGLSDDLLAAAVAAAARSGGGVPAVAAAGSQGSGLVPTGEAEAPTGGAATPAVFGSAPAGLDLLDFLTPQGEETPLPPMVVSAAGALHEEGGTASIPPSNLIPPLADGSLTPDPADTADLAGLPVSFIENRGQWQTPAVFVAWNSSFTVHLEHDGIRLHRGGDQPALVSLTFKGAAEDVALIGEDRQSGYYNFFLGNDPAEWRSQVAAYGSVLYDGLYEGVDVRVREDAGQFAYDLLLQPGADLDQVVIRVEGISGLELADDGSLILQTTGGPLRQTAPVTWEVLPSGEQRIIESGFRILDAEHFGFVAPDRDPGLPLVVDPGLDWGTFLGGHGDDQFGGLALVPDGSGDIIIAGNTRSPDFPHTLGNLRVIDYGTFLSPTWTPYVARLNATGTALVYATFFGGSGVDSVQDVAVDAAGQPVVVGDTNSEDFPTTPGAYDRTGGNCCSGDYDAYVIKFNASGSGLVFGTYLAGSPNAGQEIASHVAYDPSGSVIVSGTANSADFPTTPGAYPGQPGLFVSRFNPTGTQLTYSAFIGPGSVYAMTVDGNGIVTLTGQTASTAFPTTPDAFQPTYQGNRDAFVTRLALNGGGTADLKYSTYLGGAQHLESANAVTFDPTNPELVTVAGFTRSGDFPTTVGAYQRIHPTPVDGSVAFVTRFRFPAAGPGTLLWSTLFGAPGNQNATAVVVDDTGAAIIVGSTAVNNPPTTERAYDRIPNKTVGLGTYDAFAARISSDGSRLLYSTLLGGYAGDVILDAAYVGGTSIIVGGLTNSPDFPTTLGAFDRVYAADGQESGGATPGTLAYDAFVARLTLEPNATTDVTPPPAPQLRWPSDGATFAVPILNVPFDWTDVADESGIAAYHLQLSPNPTFTNDIAAELRGWFEPWLPASLVVKGFDVNQNGTWYWRVQALDRAGNLGPWSEVRSLNAVDPPVSPAPTLSSPPNGGKFAPGEITFAWQEVANARYYQLQVDTRSDFSSGRSILVSYLTKSQHKLNLPEGRYWWRVRLANDITVGPWSGAWSLELKNGEPRAPVPPPPSTSTSTPPLALSPAELWANPTGQLTVTLSNPAPAGGAVISLASVYPDNIFVPASVTVPEGSTSVTFTVTAGPGRGGSGVVAEYAGVLEAASVYVAETDKSPELNSLVLSPSVVIGGSSTQGTVALPSGWRAGTGGALVTLASGDLSRASVPASVLIPEGANSTTFPITTQPVSTPTWLPIFASRSITLATRLTLLPVGSAVSSLTLSPTSVSGGSSAQGTVTLNFTAPAGGIVVKLASSNTAVARVPASVTVPAGATSASFTVTTSSVASNTTVMITATMADTSQSANLTVTAPTGPLPAPTLMFPSNGARFSPGQTITFDWSDVSGAASYTIQIDDSNTFSAPQIVSQTVTPSTYSTSTLPTKKMWWRVRANDAAGNPGAWSTVREIEVKS